MTVLCTDYERDIYVSPYKAGRSGCLLLTKQKQMHTNTLFGDASAKSEYWTLDDLAAATTAAAAASPTKIKSTGQSLLNLTKPVEAARTAILQLRCDCVRLAVTGNPPLNQRQQWLGKMRRLCEFLCTAAAASKDGNGANEEEPSLSHSELELLVGEASNTINTFAGLAV